MYIKTTRHIKVTVTPQYLENQSDPLSDHYVWSYRIRVENLGKETVQLHSRYWQITDDRGQVQEVHGEGVIGEQPIIAPGEDFEYTSGAALKTPSGIMVGHYTMESKDNGQKFELAIPAFSLDSPYQVMRPH